MEQGREMRKEIVPFSEILHAVERGEDSDWDYIDANLDSNSSEAIEFALSEGPTSSNPDYRDLAYTIWEISDKGMPDEVKDMAISELSREPEGEGDNGRYARFRAAFALFKNGDRSEKVLSLIKEATQDEDVTEIAEGYLRELKDQNV